MIKEALSFIKSILNQNLKNRLSIDTNIVELNRLIEPDGSISLKNENKMIITLINLDLERARPYYTERNQVGENSLALSSGVARFISTLLFTSNFADYQESLKFLNETISFFHNNSSFTYSTFPSLPEGIEALNFDIENSTYQETHNLWSSMGAKYQPSIIYKVRYIPIYGDEIKQLTTVVTNSSNRVSP